MAREKLVGEIAKLSPEEIVRRYEQAQGLNQELHAVQRKITQRIGERADLKGNLDKLSEDIKSKEDKLHQVQRDIQDVLDGIATGQLPFGQSAGADGKPTTLAELKMKPAEVAEALYPDLIADLERNKVVPVNRACTLPGQSVRLVVVPLGGKDKDRYLMIPLHESGWVAPASHALIPHVTGKAVEFMEKAHLLGTRDESLLIEAKLPKIKSTAQNGDPGSATRGAGHTRAMAALGVAVDVALDAAITDNDAVGTGDLQTDQSVVLALVGLGDINAIGELSIGELESAAAQVAVLDPKVVAKALANEVEEPSATGKKKRGRRAGKKK